MVDVLKSILVASGIRITMKNSKWIVTNSLQDVEIKLDSSEKWYSRLGVCEFVNAICGCNVQ